MILVNFEDSASYSATPFMAVPLSSLAIKAYKGSHNTPNQIQFFVLGMPEVLKPGVGQASHGASAEPHVSWVFNSAAEMISAYSKVLSLIEQQIQSGMSGVLRLAKDKVGA